VNLPTRGLRHSFSQVLQAEPGKPMTVSFAATDLRDVNWTARILGAGVAFLVLWIGVATVTNRMTRHA
jgi:hypothetical protein